MIMLQRRLLLLALSAVLACQTGEAPPTGEPDLDEAALGHPAVVDLVLDPEQEADLPVIGGIGTASHELQLAWSGTRYLAVWVQEGTGIRFARIAADGSWIDAESVFLAYGSSPTVAFFGGFLVAIDEGSVVELWRVGQQGSITRIGYVGASNRGKLPDIAAGTGEAMIVFTDDGLSEGRIFASRFDGSEVSPFVQLGGNANRDGRPHIAYRPGGDYLAVWENTEGNVRGRLLSPAGEPGATMTIANTADAEDAPAVAFAGASFAVVWRATVAGGVQIRAALVSPTGEVGPPIDVSSVMAFAGAPSISCDTSCTVLWSGGPDADRAQLWGRRLAADLAPLGAEQVVIGGASAQGDAELAGPAGDQYLVWLDGRGGLVEAYGATASIGDEGIEIGEQSILPIGENHQEAAAVAASNSSWLVGWSDSRNGGADVFGRRFGLDGVPRTPTARPIHEEEWIQRGGDLGWNGSRFLAAWAHDEPRPLWRIRATRLEANGTVVDPDGITLGPKGLGDAAITVAGGGASGWLVAWQRGSGAVDTRVFASVVTPDGSASVPLELAGGIPAAAFDADAGVYLLVWAHRPEAGGLEILAMRIAPDGTQLDPVPVILTTTGGTDLDIAFGAGRFLVVFEDDDRVFGLRAALGPAGIEALDAAPFPIDPSAGFQRSPAVTFAARGFLVAYERVAFGGSYDIHGVQLAPTGVPGSAFVLVDGPSAEWRPALAGASQGRVLLAFARLELRDPNDFLPGYRSRIYVRRLVIGYPNGAACTSGSQCESGFCADGRCCDSACGDSVEDCQACSAAAGASADGVCTILADGEICRRRADPFCDRAERCDGASASCPADLGAHPGEVCDADCGAVCPLADPSGSPHACPACP